MLTPVGCRVWWQDEKQAEEVSAVILSPEELKTAIKKQVGTGGCVLGGRRVLMLLRRGGLCGGATGPCPDTERVCAG